MKSSVISLAAAIAMAAAGTAAAHTATYAGNLLGSSEVPVATTTGHGTARITFDLDLLTMRVQATFADLVGNVTASHIHCCTLPGSNVGVATQLPTFVGFPLGGKSGSYDHTFDMSLASSYSAAFVTNNGGTVGSAFNALVLGLDAGKASLNVHTNSFPGGEIRALLAPVPEPTTTALMLGGPAVLGWAAKRRQQA